MPPKRNQPAGNQPQPNKKGGNAAAAATAATSSAPAPAPAATAAAPVTTAAAAAASTASASAAAAAVASPVVPAGRTTLLFGSTRPKVPTLVGGDATAAAAGVASENSLPSPDLPTSTAATAAPSTATPNGPTTEAKLFVGQIPFECDEARLRALFESYGTVLQLHVMQDGAGARGGGGGGGYGGSGSHGKGRAAFVTYASTQEADAAVFTLHNRYRMLTNRALQVSYAKNSPNISAFGRHSAMEVASNNRSNPMPD